MKNQVFSRCQASLIVFSNEFRNFKRKLWACWHFQKHVCSAVANLPELSKFCIGDHEIHICSSKCLNNLFDNTVSNNLGVSALFFQRKNPKSIIRKPNSSKSLLSELFIVAEGTIKQILITLPPTLICYFCKFQNRVIKLITSL